MAEKPGSANRAPKILRAMMFRADEWGLCARLQPLPRHSEEPAQPCRGVPRRGRVGPARTRARRPGGGMARGHRRGPAAGAHRMLPQRGAQSTPAGRRSQCAEPGRFEDWPARGRARRSLASARRRAAPCGRPRSVPVSAPRRRPGRVQPRGLLARSLHLHDLRHTAASRPVMSGEGLQFVGRLLGHNRHRTAAGYTHLADAHLVEATEKAGAIIATATASQRPRPITHRQSHRSAPGRGARRKRASIRRDRVARVKGRRTLRCGARNVGVRSRCLGRPAPRRTASDDERLPVTGRVERRPV